MNRLKEKRKLPVSSATNFSVFDKLTEGFYAVDTSWRYIYVNKAATLLAGMSKSQLLGRTPEEIFPDAHRGEFGRIARLVMEDKKSRTFEAYYERYDRWYESVMFPIPEGLGILSRDITKRKEIEQSLLFATEQFQTLADNIPNLAWMATPDGEVFWYNTRWYTYTGASPKHMPEMGWKAIVSSASLSQVLARWQAALDSKKEFEMVIPLRKKNGIYRKFLTKVVPVKDTKGNVLRWFGTSTDVTHQLQAEEDQLRFAAIVTSSDDPIISKDLDGIVTSWNRAAEAMFGYKASEIIGKSIRLTVPPELQKQEDEILAKLRKGQRVEHFQTVRMTKDGRRIPISLTISPIRNAMGEIIGASNITHDISRLKQNEENLSFLAEASKELSASLDYGKTLQKIASLAVPHIADWCSVDMLNESGELELVGLAHKDPKQVQWALELRAKYPVDLQTNTGLPKVLKTGKSEFYPYIDDALLVASARSESELALLRKLGFTSVIISPIVLDQKPVGAISFVTTESRKRYTKADLSIVEELASRASLAIEHARLYQQIQRELTQRKKLEKQKDEFIGVASHELKTPVTSIKSFTQILYYRFKKEGRLKEAELLGKLDMQINKLTGLIGDLLDVTKIEAGKMLFTESTFAFDDLVAEIVEEMQRTTEKHTLIVDGVTKKHVFGDRERIGQVITNLISNAIKYSPHAKKILIHLRVEKDMVRLCVQDFGVGIRRDKQDKVFDRFFRVSGPGKETYPGLGLGLYISSQIIKRSGGQIWVESIEGKGSTFCFTLPLNRKRKQMNRGSHRNNA